MKSKQNFLFTLGAYALVIASLVLSVPSRAQNAFDVKANYTKAEQMIPMRDGVKLFTAIYSPKDASQKYPILLNRPPYGGRRTDPKTSIHRSGLLRCSRRKAT